MGGEDMNLDNGGLDDNMSGDSNMGGQDDEKVKEIQSLAGKLAQQIRDNGGLDDNMKKQIKGVVDSALSENSTSKFDEIDEILHEINTDKKDFIFKKMNIFK